MGEAGARPDQTDRHPCGTSQVGSGSPGGADAGSRAGLLLRRHAYGGGSARFGGDVQRNSRLSADRPSDARFTDYLRARRARRRETASGAYDKLGAIHRRSAKPKVPTAGGKAVQGIAQQRLDEVISYNRTHLGLVVIEERLPVVVTQ